MSFYNNFLSNNWRLHGYWLIHMTMKLHSPFDIRLFFCHRNKMKKRAAFETEELEEKWKKKKNQTKWLFETFYDCNAGHCRVICTAS